MKTLICDCNRTMPLDAAALRTALDATPGASSDGLRTVHTALCRREAPAFQRAARDTTRSHDELLVACTQEQRLFVELNEATEGAASVAERPIRFVNIRETGGWSRDARDAAPKIAAMLAAAQQPSPPPVATVSYRSQGRVLVIGEAAEAEATAAMLADKLSVSVLLVPRRGRAASPTAQAHRWPVHDGRLTRLTGWLGAFEATWVREQPIDLDLCTRCNACVTACPEGAIGTDWRIDLDACRSHRSCVAACEAPGAIDFDRAAEPVTQPFDLVLDLRPEPAFPMHQPPQGYWWVGRLDATGTPVVDAALRLQAVLEARERVGTFEKPRFFRYRQDLCAHSRNERTGCTACIDVCSAQAIRSDASLKGKSAPKQRGGPDRPAGVPQPQGGGVVVEPHLCVGCGACATVCPSGAMTFGYPGPEHLGQRLRAMLTAYRAGGGRDAAVLVHSDGTGARLLEALGRAARLSRDGAVRGVPARVLPLPVWHTASVGLDLWLSAIAMGASQVVVLLSGDEAPSYRQALREQMAVGQAILAGLGYRGEHLRLVDGGAPEAVAADPSALDAALRAVPPAQAPARPAAFAVQADKRATLELALDHLMAEAPVGTAVPDVLPLPQPSPYGGLRIDTDRCTMCLSCVGACPEKALADNPDRPQLRFIEKNCVQCGLCVGTCPEQALALEPRLWLADGGKARRQARVLHEVQPFHCIRCGKPFGTLKAVEAIVSRLSGHAAFAGAAAQRLKMCGDCRVVDIHTNPGEVRITDL